MRRGCGAGRRLTLTRSTPSLYEAEMQLDLPDGLKAGHVEVSRQFYRRAFTLSKELDAEQIGAELNNGVLRVRIPKAAHAQPRKIEIKLG